MPEFLVVARGGASDGDLGVLTTDHDPAGQRVSYSDSAAFTDPEYLVTSRVVTLADGRSAFVAEPL